MKTNEAPEKLYFGESDKGILDIYSTKESDNEVEYTRTDAFIEKAVRWFDEHFMNRLEWEIATYEFKDIQSLKEDFKKAIKL